MDAFKIDVLAGGVVQLKAAYAHEFGKAELALEVKLVDILKIAAASSENKIDDALVAMVEKALA